MFGCLFINTHWQVRYWEQLVGHIVIFTASLVGCLSAITITITITITIIIIITMFVKVVEVLMVVVSLRGSVMDDRPRESMQCLVYIKQGGWISFWYFCWNIWLKEVYTHSAFLYRARWLDFILVFLLEYLAKESVQCFVYQAR